jgi:hypothetical protein
MHLAFKQQGMWLYASVYQRSAAMRHQPSQPGTLADVMSIAFVRMRRQTRGLEYEALRMTRLQTCLSDDDVIEPELRFLS